MKKKQMMILGTLLLLLSFLGACSSAPEKPQEVLRTVRYQIAETEVVASQRSFSGVSVAATETKISFRVSGLLEQLNIKVGQQIRKGDLIASLDDRDLNLNYEESKAARLNAQVQADNANSNLLRVRELYENDNVALSEYEQAKNSYASAKADLEARQKQLDLQKSQLQYSQIHSPMTGIVTQVPVTKNENVSAGEAIAVLSSNKNVEVEASIPEAYIAAIKTGMAARVTFSSLPNKSYPGVITEVAYAASESSTYPVTVKLDQSDTKLRPGMSSEVHFSFNESDVAAIRVPASAVAEDLSGNFVYLVLPSENNGIGTIERRTVVVSNLTNLGFIVLDGLKEGDVVVTAGVSKISPGMKVRFDSTVK